MASKLSYRRVIDPCLVELFGRYLNSSDVPILRQIEDLAK